MKNFFYALSASLFLLLGVTQAFGSAAPGEKRVALVIGNANYKNTIALPNTINDASAMAQSLRRLGFDVVDGIDLTQDTMNRTMKTFARKIHGADVALFFYAGHGMQVGGENFLIPIDAALKHESDLEFEAIKVRKVVQRMSSAARIKLVILDACRDNPLAQTLSNGMSERTRSLSNPSAGMAAMHSAASGTLVAFATAPGRVALDGGGKHSPFTQALLHHIETPGLDIDVMMKRVRGHVAKSTGERQQPWTNSALNGEFYLKKAVVTSSATSNAKVASLTPAVVAPVTTNSIVTGKQVVTRSVSDETRAQIDLATWNVAYKGGQGVKADYEAYLASHPTGLFAAQARAQLTRLSATAGHTSYRSVGSQNTKVAMANPAIVTSPAEKRLSIGTKQTELMLGLKRSDWRYLQSKLTNLGFRTRGVDGVPGRGTRTAIRNWQASRGYQQTGYFDKSQRQALAVEHIPASVARKRSSAKKVRKSRKKSGKKYTKKRARSRSRRRKSSGGNDFLGKAIGVGVGIAIGRAMRR